MYEIIAWSTYVKALHTRYRILEVTVLIKWEIYIFWSLYTIMIVCH